MINTSQIDNVVHFCMICVEDLDVLININITYLGLQIAEMT